MNRAADVPRPAALLPSLIVAAVTGAALFIIGFSGGSYDLVDRQTAGLVIWWAIGIGALVVVPGPRRPGTAGLLVTMFAALIAVWIALNLGRSISEERGVTELARAVTHLGPIVLIGWVLPARYWRGVFGGLVAAAVVILFCSLIARLSPGALGQQVSVVFTNTTSRLAFPFGYWNAIGSWSVMTTLLLLATTAHSPRWYVRSATLAVIPVATTVGYMTYSRSSIGAMALGLVILMVLARNRVTTGLSIAAAAAGSLITIQSVHGAKAIADSTGSADAGGVVVAMVIVGVVLAVIGAVLSRVGVDRIRMPLRMARIAGVITLAGVIVVGGVLVSSYGNKAWHQFENQNSGDGADPTARLTSLNGTRIAQWRIALKSYDENKLHGTGAGTFELTNNLNTKSGEFVRNAHNAFIEALAEQGWPGLLFLVGMLLSIVAAIGVAVKRATTAPDRGLIAGAAAAMGSFTLGTAVDWFWQVTSLAMLFMGLAAVVVAAGRDLQTESVAEEPALPVGAHGAPVDGPDDTPVAAAHDPSAAPDAEAPVAPEPPNEAASPRQRPRRVWPLRAAIFLVAVVAILVELPGLVGTSDIRRSQQDVAAGNLTQARSRADQAINTMPWASSPFLQRALVDEQAGQWESAIRAAHLAIERDPFDWRLPLVLARIEAKGGHPVPALAAYRKAKSLRPTGSFFR